MTLMVESMSSEAYSKSTSSEGFCPSILVMVIESKL